MLRLELTDTGADLIGVALVAFVRSQCIEGTVVGLEVDREIAEDLHR